MGGCLSKDDFAKLLFKLQGLTLSVHVIDVIFAVFDNGRGDLDVEAFLNAMQRREIMWARRVS